MAELPNPAMAVNGSQPFVEVKLAIDGSIYMELLPGNTLRALLLNATVMLNDGENLAFTYQGRDFFLAYKERPVTS